MTQTSLPALLRLGLIAGVFASLAAGAFTYFLAEPVVDTAIAFEAAALSAEAEPGMHAHEEVFSRATQRSGLLAGLLVTGVSLGALFAVGYWLLYRREARGSSGPDTVSASWGRSLRLAAAVWAATWLLPFLLYPANPPGAGDPDTVGMRMTLYFAAVGFGVVIALASALLHRRLFIQGVAASYRRLAVTALVLVGICMATLLPGSPGDIGVPAAMLWEFRLHSIGTSLILWGALGAAFGVLAEGTAGQAVRRALPFP